MDIKQHMQHKWKNTEWIILIKVHDFNSKYILSTGNISQIVIDVHCTLYVQYIHQNEKISMFIWYECVKWVIFPLRSIKTSMAWHIMLEEIA